MSEAPRYRVTKPTYLDLDRIYEPGETATYAGLPGSSLEPLNEAAEYRKLEAAEARAKRTPGIPPSPASLVDDGGPAAAKAHALELELTAAEETFVELAESLQAVTAERDAALAEVATLQDEIAALKAAAKPDDAAAKKGA
jgi:hypothetical protein